MNPDEWDTSRQAPLVAPLEHFRRGDIALAGGKGANLGELKRSGFAVPPGFVITTAAYNLALQDGNLSSLLDEALDHLNPDEPSSVSHASRQISDALKAALIPVPIANQIMKAYRELGAAAVAVRSSATAEDLPGAAFAGQQDTFLNVIGQVQLLDSVRGCWASLWSERAISYRNRRHMDPKTVKIAVVVQQMVPADAAGVMFTVNPVSGNKEELVIDASPGLGEAVVSGLVTPDHYVVDKPHARIKEQRLGRNEVVIQSKPGGGTERTNRDRDQANAAALPAPALIELAKVGIAVERHLSGPQDIEWAWAKDGNEIGNLFVLQARPITALPEPIRVEGAARRLIPILAEMWPSRPYPLDVTTFTAAAERAIGHLLVSLIGKAAPDPEKVLVEEDGVVVRFNPPEIHASPSIVVALLSGLWRTRNYDPSRWVSETRLADLIAHASDLDRRDLRRLSWTGVVGTLREGLALLPRFMEIRERYFSKSLLALGGLWLLLVLTRHRAIFGILLTGVETKTAETNRALEALALKIRRDHALSDLFANLEPGQLRSALQDSEAGRTFLQDFESFLSQYGHRETSLTISEGTWRDQPEVVLGILKVLASSDLREPDEGRKWEKARDDLLQRSILGKWPFRGALLNSLRDGRALIEIREDTHFYATLVQPTVRRAALELGDRLFQVGALEAPADVFHLRLEELVAAGNDIPLSDRRKEEIRALVARRRAKRESLANRPMIDPRLLGPSAEGQGKGNVLLSGSPGSPGVAIGPARLILDASHFGELRAGEVLVAPATNPAWTPLFQRAAGIVVDTGGSASHAAIVAREYGIPAVMGTATGTRQLTTGQMIQVDGSRGLVLEAEKKQ